jgi:hypothetical protein
LRTRAVWADASRACADFCIGCKDQHQEKQGQKIRMVGWNLNWFSGRKGEATAQEAKAHIQRAQTAPNELKPDILSLQEVRASGIFL